MAVMYDPTTEVVVEREVSIPAGMPFGTAPYVGEWVFKVGGRVVDRDTAAEAWTRVSRKPFGF